MFTKIVEGRNKRIFVMLGIFFVFLITTSFIIYSLFLPKQKGIKYSKASNNQAKIIFDSSNLQPAENEKFTVSVKVKSPLNMNMRLYKIVVNFSKSSLQATDIRYKVGNPAVLGNPDTSSTLNIVNSRGKINLLSQITQNIGYALKTDVETEVATLTFKRVNTNLATIEVNASVSSLQKINTDGSISEINFETSTVSFSGLLNTPTLTITGDLSCLEKWKKGDIDCDGQVGVRDFVLLFNEIVKNCSGSNVAGCGIDENHDGKVMDADYNNNGQVDVQDYTIWHSLFLYSLKSSN